MSFPCSQCGLCCQHIDKVAQLHDYQLASGNCRFYAEGVGCTIYENRPVVCKVDVGYEKFFSTIISKKDYYKENANTCNKLQILYGLDEKFRVIL